MSSVFDKYQDAKQLAERLGLMLGSGYNPPRPDSAADFELARRDFAAVRDAWNSAAQAIAEAAVLHKRELSDNEAQHYADAIRYSDLAERQVQTLASLEQYQRDFRAQRGISSNDISPLAVSAEVMDAVQAAIEGRTAGKWEARAALATANTGGRHTWSAPTLAGPRLLHLSARVPTEPVNAIAAEYLKAGAMASAASVAENITVSELTSVTGASATLARYGRWTSFSTESRIASDAAGTVTSLQRKNVAYDLDAAFITAVAATAPSGAVTGTDAPAGLRIGIATVVDAVGCEPGDLVIIAPPSAAGLIEDVTPDGARSLAETFTSFAGARLYFSSLAAANTAFVVYGGAFRFFEAQPFTLATDVDVKTGTITVATSVIAGFGSGLVAGGALKVGLS